MRIRQPRNVVRLGLMVLGVAVVWWLARLPIAAQQQRADKPAEPEGKRQPVFVSWFGADSRITQPEKAILRDNAAWEQLWRRHIGLTSQNERGRDPIPLVDFNHCCVFAYFGGQGFNSEGFYVESLTEQADRWLMRIDEHTFQTSGPGGGGVRVTPFGIFVFPRTTKPLVVERNVQDLIGRPPIWKECARFDGGS